MAINKGLIGKLICTFAICGVALTLGPELSLAGNEKLCFELRSLLLQGAEKNASSSPALKRALATSSLKGTDDTILGFIRVNRDSEELRNQITSLGVTLRTFSGGSIFTANIPLASVPALIELEGVVKVAASKRAGPALYNSISRINADKIIEKGFQGPFGRLITGKGVIVGIVDSGVYINHETFLDESGQKHRFRYIWDLSQDSDLGEGGTPYVDPVTGFNLGGVECRFDGDSPCLEVDNAYRGHGTHVLGIAAGRGRPKGLPDEGVFRGVAPGAELIAVKFLGTGCPGLEKVAGFDVEIIEGINYIFQKADEAGMPAVINLSWGMLTGPRDGTGPMEIALDEMTGPGRIIVAAAGNEGAALFHDEIVFSPLNKVENTYFSVFDFAGQSWPWRVGNSVEIEGYYLVNEGAPADLLKLRLTNPTMENIVGQDAPHYYPYPDSGNPCSDEAWSEHEEYFLQDTNEIDECYFEPEEVEEGEEEEEPPKILDGIIEIDHRFVEARANGKELRGFKIRFTGHESAPPLAMSGKWRIALEVREDIDDSDQNIVVDIWINGILGVANQAPYFYYDSYSDSSKTLRVPCTADNVICVGAVDSTCEWNAYLKEVVGSYFAIEPQCEFFSNGWGKIADFSSIGPRKDGVEKPDIVAPGRAVISAFSADRDLEVEIVEPGVMPEEILNKIVLEGDGQYELKAGTSMAAPLVAGTVALMLQVDPEMTPAEARNYLTEHARPYNPYVGWGVEGFNPKYGHGRLDAEASVRAVMKDNNIIVTAPGLMTQVGQGGDDKCFIATVAFGAGDFPAVEKLRDLCGRILSKSAFGRWVIKKYFASTL